MCSKSSEIEFKPVVSWEEMNKNQLNDVMCFGDKYIDFLNAVHTERQAADYIINAAKESGFKDFNDVIKGVLKFDTSNSVKALQS